MIVLIALALYAAAGVTVAAAFVVFGVARVLPEPAPVTVDECVALMRAYFDRSGEVDALEVWMREARALLARALGKKP